MSGLAAPITDAPPPGSISTPFGFVAASKAKVAAAVAAVAVIGTVAAIAGTSGVTSENQTLTTSTASAGNPPECGCDIFEYRAYSGSILSVTGTGVSQLSFSDSVAGSVPLLNDTTVTFTVDQGDVGFLGVIKACDQVYYTSNPVESTAVEWTFSTNATSKAYELQGSGNRPTLSSANVPAEAQWLVDSSQDVIEVAFSLGFVSECPPSPSPTAVPSQSPTKWTASPTKSPTKWTASPSSSPTASPTLSPVPPTPPTTAPTASPVAPTPPTLQPTGSPTKSPTPPTRQPTNSPTTSPTSSPTKSPTQSPTSQPTSSPTPPTSTPTSSPTVSPNSAPITIQNQTDAPTTSPTPSPITPTWN